MLRVLPERAATVVVTAPELAADIEAASSFPDGFLSFLKHWHFKNRESGQDLTFAQLWPGQQDFAKLMIEVANKARDKGDWEGIFALKAGKLGFTELECAWDGYVSWSLRNGRIHLFSKEEDAAKEMLVYVRYGLARLDSAWGVHFLDRQDRAISAEKSASQVLRLAVFPPGTERDYGDIRTIQAYATSKHPAIDKTAQHAHVDEWCHMEDPKGVWSSIGTTISPDGGTCHIVSRGNGENKDVEDTWASSIAGVSKLRAFFAPWTRRPGRDQGWLEAQAATLRTVAAVSHFAPETPEDAFRGDEDNEFVAIEWWDRCFDPSIAVWIPQGDGPTRRELPDGNVERGRWRGNLGPGDLTPLILGGDCGISHDYFGMVGAGRHPERHEDPAIRLCQLWRPEDFEDGVIHLDNVQGWIRTVCDGGCPLGHPTADFEWRSGKRSRRLVGQEWEPGECPACAAILAGQMEPMKAFNVVQFVYDPYQLEGMAQELRRDNVTWCNPMNQGKERLEADRQLYDLVVNRRLGHPGDERLREHIGNAKSKTQRDDDSKLRMIKKAPHRRIDLAVAAAMAVSVASYLNL